MFRDGKGFEGVERLGLSSVLIWHRGVRVRG